MTYGSIGAAPRRIAVIGAGISGMGAAHLLAPSDRVTLFEAEPAIGGHARTRMAGPARDQAVDTGFIVFNHANYPHLTALFDELSVPLRKSDMSFGASIRGGEIEYALRNLGSLFAQKKNLLRPQFYRMVRDILHFNRNALAMSREPGLTIDGLLDRLGTGEWFREHYLFPLSGAIWSTPAERIRDFPAHAMMQFFENHALLQSTGQHQWWTVEGGSASYVSRLESAMRRRGVEIRTSSPIAGVRRTPRGVEVKAHGAEWELFDDVVFATHSDDTLRLLSDPTPRERRVLGAIGYQPNRIVLHSDESIMPKRRAIWSSWTYSEPASGPTERIDLTYWMNSLQTWLKRENFFVTLNTTRPIREDLIWDETVLRHPVYDLAALGAQEEARAMNGENATWFCGAWMRHGFHEDGLSSAVDVVRALRQRDRMTAVAAE